MESPICPGYLISLPKVREAAHARGWAKTGQLALRLDNVAVTQNLMDAIDWIDAEESAVEIWVMRDKSGKG